MGILTSRSELSGVVMHPISWNKLLIQALECQFLGTVRLPWLDSCHMSAGVLRCHNDSTSPSTASAHTAIRSLFPSQPLASISASSGLPLVSVFPCFLAFLHIFPPRLPPSTPLILSLSDSLPRESLVGVVSHSSG